MSDAYAPSEAAPAKRDSLDPMEVPRGVWALFTGNPVGFFLASVSYMGAMVGMILGIIALVFACMAPGLLLEDDLVLAIGGIIGFSAYALILLVLTFVISPLMNASLIRAIDGELAGDDPIGFGSPFSTLRQSPGRVILFMLLSQALIFAGMLLFYIPGLIAAALSAFALPMVVLDESVDPVEALKRGFAHMQAQTSWHLVVWLGMVLAIVVIEFTVVGLLFLMPLMVAWQVVAYRQVHPRD